MSGINPINNINIGFSALSTGRGSADNSHTYIQSCVNALYTQALCRQTGFTGARALRRFIDSNSQEGKRLHKIV